MHGHPWCNSWHFCCHCTRCWLPCGTRKITHTSPLTTFHFFHWQVDIVFTKDGIHSLTNVVIADPTWANLLRQCCTTWGFVASKTTKAKKKSYRDQHPIDHFIPLTIEVFGCLNKQVDVFSHNYANAMWNFKGPLDLPIYVLVSFFDKKISITLQRMQASSILNWTIAVGLTTS
jgi:hypothetical protein